MNNFCRCIRFTIAATVTLFTIVAPAFAQHRLHGQKFPKARYQVKN